MKKPIVNRGLIDNVLHYAGAMAGFAAERALTKAWTNHPMFGISVGHDKKAKSYQEVKKLLIELLKEHEKS